MFDCPQKEDEEDCSTCPGLYRCLSSQVCLLHIHLCDDVFHCPHRDDELLCDFTCPQTCICHGMAFTCVGRFPDDIHTFPYLRYLDVRGGGADGGSGGGGGGGGGDEAGTVEKLQQHTLLIHVSIKGRHLTQFNVSLPNLNSLDLRHNHITCLCRRLSFSVP